MVLGARHYARPVDFDKQVCRHCPQSVKSHNTFFCYPNKHKGLLQTACAVDDLKQNKALYVQLQNLNKKIKCLNINI